MDFAAALAHGLPVAFLAVWTGGLLTALTPCVYPLIPVTVSIFGARKTARRSEAALLSGAYVLGMAAMYSALGVSAALTGRLFGRFMSDPRVIGAIALVFAALAASMFGAFELELPPPLRERFGRMSGGSSPLAGAIAMGLVAGLIAAPCTGPVLGAVLAFVATTRNALLGFSLLFVFALGMGLPFFVIGTFAVSLPKPGRWMEYVKSVFGVVLLAMALYFLKDAWPALKAPLRRDAGFVAGAVGLIVVGVGLGAVHRSFAGPWRERALKAAGVLLAVAGLYGVAGAATIRESGPVAWITSEPAGIAAARVAGKPALIDFTADWCAACKELEAKTYPTAEFQAEARRFVLVKIDATNAGDDAVDRVTEKYGVAGLPAVVFLDSKGNIVPDVRVQGFVDAPEMVARMRRIR